MSLFIQILTHTMCMYVYMCIYMQYGIYKQADIYNIFMKVGRVSRRNKTKCSFEHFVRVCACVHMSVHAYVIVSVSLSRIVSGAGCH